jgi:hypothetical protein
MDSKTFSDLDQGFSPLGFMLAKKGLTPESLFTSPNEIFSGVFALVARVKRRKDRC